MEDDGNVPAPEGALADLVGTERRVESRVAAAEAEAERLVESARARARSAVDEAMESLEEALQSLRASIERECGETVRLLEDRATAEAERYRSLSEEETSHLADWVVSRLLEGPSGS